METLREVIRKKVQDEIDEQVLIEVSERNDDYYVSDSRWLIDSDDLDTLVGDCVSSGEYMEISYDGALYLEVKQYRGTCHVSPYYGGLEEHREIYDVDKIVNDLVDMTICSQCIDVKEIIKDTVCDIITDKCGDAIDEESKIKYCIPPEAGDILDLGEESLMKVICWHAAKNALDAISREHPIMGEDAEVNGKVRGYLSFCSLVQLVDICKGIIPEDVTKILSNEGTKKEDVSDTVVLPSSIPEELDFAKVMLYSMRNKIISMIEEKFNKGYNIDPKLWLSPLLGCVYLDHRASEYSVTLVSDPYIKLSVVKDDNSEGSAISLDMPELISIEMLIEIYSSMKEV